jgi:predicted adenine nucleotide alpha hydrolase (AANH) superfamily ATPase
MKIVLHICCGVCAAGAAKILLKEGHSVVGFFCNPNLYPPDEYSRRLESARKVALNLGFPLESVPFAPGEWYLQTESLKGEPEGGKRCQICFRLRLEKTFSHLQQCSADVFTTTLSISPHKSTEVVNRIGREIGGGRFLERNFKEKEAFKQAKITAKQWDLYQQNYCGCKYSIKPQKGHSQT